MRDHLKSVATALSTGFLTATSAHAAVVIDGLTVYTQNATDTELSLETNTVTSGLSGDAVFVDRVNANSNGQNSNIGLNLTGLPLSTVGDQVEFSFDFRYTAAPTGFFRVALFENGGQGHILGDEIANWQTAGDTSYYTLSEWNGSQRWGLREELPNTAINNAGSTIAGLTNAGTGSYGTGVHTYTLSLELTADGLQINNTVVDSLNTTIVDQNFLDATPFIDQVDGAYIRFDATNDLYVGNFTATTGETPVIPEPATLSLIAIGGAALFGRRRRE